ncbi:hypothetical protein [Nodularia spumigena]|nr:hypothetical protein [Nodularia spumigena]MDB9339309.1 hypothetical protein [Nodularia spumigena CS-589/07]MDB9500547.1 hypothetical protein [Nodularia spumigena CS-336/02]
MLPIPSQYIHQANLPQPIRCELINAKHLPDANRVFDMVISNSLVYH